MSSLAELRAKPHTSISQMKAFIACPMRYHLQYVAREEPAFRALALVFGTAWHATVGEHLLRSDHEHQVPIDELRAHLRDGIVTGIGANGPPVLFEEEQNVGAVVDVAMKMLTIFVDRVPLPDKVRAVELPFSIAVLHPITGEMLPRPLIGAIDAVVMENGNAAVWELKSGKRRWSGDQLEFDLQMTGYRMAARHLGYGEVDLKLLVTTKSKVPDVQVELLVRHRRDESEFAELAVGVHRAITAGVDHRIRSWACRSCPFANACGS